MSETLKVNDDITDERPLVVNGRRYYIMTARKCTTCSGDDRYMYVKQKLSGGDVVLECPNCDDYITLARGMVNFNLNKS